MPRTFSRSPQRIVMLAATGALTAAALSGPLLGSSTAGGHVDAPSSIKDTAADLTDVYAFTSPDNDDTVTLIANVRPFQLPATAANALVDYPFADGARYEIHIDADGDGEADTTYRWTFETKDNRPPFPPLPKVGPQPVTSLDSKSLHVRQTYTLERVREGKAEKVASGTAAPTHTGKTLMPDYKKLRSQAVEKLSGGGRALASQSADAFKANTQAFGLYTAGTAGPVPKWMPDANPLKQLNVNSLVVQVPKKEVALKGDPKRNPVIGVWTTVSRQGADMGRSLAEQAPSYRQVSRQGTPHIAFGLYGTTIGLQKPGGPEDKFQQRPPEEDQKAQDFLKTTLDPVPPKRIAKFNPKYPAPATPRKDIQALFLKGIGKDNGAKFGYDLNTHAMNADADRDDIALAEELRLNLTTPVTSKPNPDGLLAGDKQGFPNGRRLNDNIDGPLIRMLMGDPDGSSAEGLLPKPLLDMQPADAQSTFPYLNPPNSLL
ncbi:DUF4331 domain-containing protein [Streptomyces venezuelae]|uniref:DUF4331 domain-containing protein n=1 Tax=Streptomyces venezuelae TaxID=54571 RepID=UPI00365E1B29